MIKKTLLDNGITVLSENVPGSAACALGFWFKTGTRWDPAEYPGLAHFAEHMFFKSTAKRSALQLAQEMDLLGGRANAFTEQEQTCFHSVTLGEHLGRAFDFLTDMLLNPLFDEEELEREKGVVCEEIRMVDDSPDELASDLFYSACWPNHPLGRPIQGTVESVSSISRSVLKNFCSEFYRPHRLTIAAAGNVNHDYLADLAQKYWGSIPDKRHEEDLCLPGGVPQASISKIIRNKPTEQVSLCFGGPSISAQDSRYYAFWLLDSILGDSLSCRLFQEIRENCGLAYSVETFRESYLDAGLFGAEVGTSAENAAAVLEKIRSIFADVRRLGVKKEELELAKLHRKSAFMLNMESVLARMERLVHDERIYGRYVSSEEVCSAVSRVSAEDIYELAQIILDTEKYSLTAVGPAEDIGL